MTIDEHELFNGINELRAFVGMLRYMVEQASDEATGDVFFALANAADAIHSKLNNATGKATG